MLFGRNTGIHYFVPWGRFGTPNLNTNNGQASFKHFSLRNRFGF